MTILDDTFDDTFGFFQSLFPRNVVPPGNYPPWNLEDDRIKSLLFGQGYPAYPNVQLPYLNSNTAPITLKYKFAGNYTNPRELAFVNSVREILEERIEPLINVDFVEVNSSSSEPVHITYKIVDEPGTPPNKPDFSAQNTPINNASTRNLIEYNFDWFDYFGRSIIDRFKEGEDGYSTIIHETLHALGLKHPGRYNGGFSERVSERDLGTAPYLMDDELFGIDGYQLDNTSNTIMTYNEAGAFESTPMPYDMLALHYLYGVGDLNSGDTTYNFHDVDRYSSNDLVNGHIVTQTWGTTISGSDSKIALWDRSGIDTFDLSGLKPNTSGYRIDLTFDDNESIEGWAGGFVTTNDAYNSQISYFARDHSIDELLAGDWDGDGDDEFAVRRDGTIFMDTDGDGIDDQSQSYGNGNTAIDGVVDRYLVGDWDGDGRDNIAVRRGNDIFMDTNFDGIHDRFQAYGNGDSEDQYLVGDWDGDGQDNIAVRRGNQIIMDYDYDGSSDLIQGYGNGNSEDQYLVGDWDGDGRDNIAWRRGNNIFMDTNFDGIYDLDDTLLSGNNDSLYLVGDWNGNGADVIEIRPAGHTAHQYQTLEFGTFIAHSHIENVIGSPSNDWIVGIDNVRNEIFGEGGNDTLIGGDANYNSGNILNGGDGDDLLDGGTGNDTLDGGVGKDRLNGWEGNDSLKGGDGNDILDGGDGDDTLKGLDGNDFLDGYIGNDSLNGDSGNDTLQGDLGNDSLTAGRGNDFLDGGRGNDSLRGIDGNNTLQGGTGGDTLDGGIGSDTLNGEDDHDHLYGRDGNDSLNGGTGIDYLNGGLGNDKLDGEIGDDFLDGREGNDSLNGGDSDDLLKGGNDEDRLIGGYGNDSLAGEDGNDTLIGSNPDYYDSGSGENDTLTGGLGADTFVIGDSYEAYYLDAGNALITDFNWMEEDKIQVFGNPDDYSLVETSTIGGEVAFGMDIVYQGNTIATLVGNTGFRYVDDNTVRFDLNINQDFEFV